MKGVKKQKDNSSMNIPWGIFGCICLGQLRVCKGLCKDESCNSGLCSQAGLRLSGRGWGNLAVPKETTQITSSSHNTNHTKNHIHHPSHPSSHCHPALMGWYSAPLLLCKSSRYDAHCMPSTRPYGTCMYMLHDCQDMAEGAYLR